MPTRQKRKKKTRRTHTRALSRGMTSPAPIGPQLMDVITNLVALMRTTTDPKQLKKLDEQRIALSDEAARLIDGVLEDTSNQYRVAVEGLQQASETICKAIEGVETVKRVLLQAAKAAELVGKVAAMA